MVRRILLYGATGYSGRLIAAEARRRYSDSRDVTIDRHQVVLGGRDGAELADMTRTLELDHLVFTLDDRERVLSALRGFDVVINAAGPFARTASRLMRAAIEVGIPYVDINGEVDVYRALDDLSRIALHRGVTIVSGSGFTATVSDMMLESALSTVRPSDARTVWIAFSAMRHFSRGSLHAMLRSVRERVLVVREGKVVHVPVGRLERMFDFGQDKQQHDGTQRPNDDSRRPRPARIASAINTIDTLTASRTARRKQAESISIESYAEMSATVRLGYQIGALSAPLLQIPLVQRLNHFQIAQLPDGPSAEDRTETRQKVLLQIESPLRTTLVDWRLTTPDAYDFTARSALAVAEKVAGASGGGGWKTPSEVLGTIDLRLKDKPYPFQDCTFEDARAGQAGAGVA